MLSAALVRPQYASMEGYMSADARQLLESIAYDILINDIEYAGIPESDILAEIANTNDTDLYNFVTLQ